MNLPPARPAVSPSDPGRGPTAPSPAQAWGGSAFDSALAQAGASASPREAAARPAVETSPDAHAPEPADDSGQADPVDASGSPAAPRRTRKEREEGPPAPTVAEPRRHAAPAPPAKPIRAQVFHVEQSKNTSRSSGSDGLGAGSVNLPPPSLAAATVQAQAQAGGPDLDAFADLLARLDHPAAVGGKALTVSFLDGTAMVEGVRVARAPDGSLSLTVRSSPQAALEAGRALGVLRKRLEARGLSVGAVDLGADDEAGDRLPVGRR